MRQTQFTVLLKRESNGERIIIFQLEIHTLLTGFTELPSIPYFVVVYIQIGTYAIFSTFRMSSLEIFFHIENHSSLKYMEKFSLRHPL